MPFSSSTTGSSPLWLLGLLFLILATLSYFGYRGTARGSRLRYRIPFLFRTATFLAVTLLLGNLVLSWRYRTTTEPLVRVFFDNSVSATYHQSISGESLMNGYREIVAGLHQILDDETDGGTAEFFAFGSEVKPLDPEYIALHFNEPATNISSVMNRTNDVDDGHFLAGMVVVSDGQVTMGPDPRERAGEMNVPVYLVGIGDSTPMVDVDIERIEAPTVGIEGAMVTAVVFVSSIGDVSDRVNVTLSKDGRLLGSRLARLSGRGSVNSVDFRFRLGEEGSQTYRVQVAALKDEINIDNNRTSFTVASLKNRYRAALLTGALSPNTGFLNRVLEADDRFETHHFVRYRNGWSPPLAKFLREEYDLVILDNIPTKETTEDWEETIARKMNSFPSSLAYVAGPNVRREEAHAILSGLGLEEMPYVRRSDGEGHPVLFSDVSLRHPIFGGEGQIGISLPPLEPFLRVRPFTDKIATLLYLDAPVAIPLFTAGTFPLPGNDGMVKGVVMTSKDLWQLHFRVMRTDYAHEMERWWRRTFDWLVISEGEGETYFRLNKQTFQQGETVYVSGSVLDLGRIGEHRADVSMTVTDDRGETNSFVLDRAPAEPQWEGSFLAGRPGEYQYAISAEEGGTSRGKQTGTFKVEESQIELNRVFLNDGLLKEIADISGGSFKLWNQRASIFEAMDLEPRKATKANVFHLSHWLPLGFVVLIFMIGEWIVRRLLGLQ